MSEEMDNPISARFIGIDSIVYGIEDMDLCHRFFDDWGLRTVKRSGDESVLETRQGPCIVLRNSNAMVAIASQLAAIVTGDQQNMVPVRTLHTDFADCLPIISQ